MRIFLFFIIVFFIASNCFATISTSFLKDAVPAYDECDGVFVETIQGTSASFGFSIEKGIIGGFYGTSVSFGFTVSEGSSLTWIINRNRLVDSPPAYDACDGAFVESLIGKPIAFSFIASEGAFNCIFGSSISFGFTIKRPLQQMHLKRGIQFKQGIHFRGEDYIRWTAIPNAAILIP